LSGEEPRVLAEEHAALRRVATLVARGAPPEKVFAAVTEEVGQLLPVEFALMGRYEADGTVTSVAAWGSPVARFPIGKRWSLGGKNVTTIVSETGRPARVDHYADGSSGSIGEVGRESGFRSTVGAPILVEGRLWGAMAVGSTRVEPALPVWTEHHLSQFTDLLATAIANAESRAGLARLAGEQAALRRVATLVAGGTPSKELFGAVTDEVGQLFPVDFAVLCRYDPDRTLAFIAGWGSSVEHFTAATRWDLGGKNASTLVVETGRPARVDGYPESSSGTIGITAREGGIRSTVGAPIIVEGRVWGVMTIGSTLVGPPLPAGIEARLVNFTDLVAMAIANAESRAGLAQLAEEQAALRRVATLVADGAPPEQVFATVTEEVARLFPSDMTIMCRYVPDRAFTILGSVGSVGSLGKHWPVGSRWPLGGNNTTMLVFETGRPARIENYAGVSGAHIDRAREDGIRSSVGVPIIVEGRVWGLMGVITRRAEPLPADTEARLADFTELLASAIANAESRDELAASRARIVTAADEQRRRVVRDLHDGAQSSLVRVAIALQLALRRQDVTGEVRTHVGDALDDARSAIEELRELVHGIHPAVLTRRGLAAAVKDLAGRASAPVVVEITDERYPNSVELAAYFVTAEALTNIAKFARASKARVTTTRTASHLVLTVDDDGIGGARPTAGSGLAGLADRIETLGGTLTVSSRPGHGTHVRAEIPLSTGTATTEATVLDAPPQ
jgi:signal transduction histidine kinase